jgi:hypothetical protein
MIATETVRLVLMVLLGGCLIWAMSIVIRKDYESLVRVILVGAVIGVAFFYVNQTDLEKLSWSAVKEDIFPPKMEHYRFERREITTGGVARTVFLFDEPGPKINVVMEKGGKNLVIRNTDSLNRVLAYIGLPPVKHGVPELISITGKGSDANTYLWDDYDKGILIVEQGLFHDSSSLQSYPQIVAITVRNR